MIDARRARESCSSFLRRRIVELVGTGTPERGVAESIGSAASGSAAAAELCFPQLQTTEPRVVLNLAGVVLGGGDCEHFGQLS